MLKKNILFFLLSALMLSLASCSEDEKKVEEYADWQTKNETYFNSLYTSAQQKISNGDTSWRIYRSYSLLSDTTGYQADADDNIIVHVISEGEGTTSPLYTDTATVVYQGRLIPSTTYTAGLIFDGFKDAYNLNTAAKTDFVVGRPILTVLLEKGITTSSDGLSTALQQMHPGDRWQVYIPYNLGYGTTDSGSIPAYSTLIFDITLISYKHPGGKAQIYE
jgi:FKBP-type peptidyl-prolyl cis-trans isomerase FklB